MRIDETSLFHYVAREQSLFQRTQEFRELYPSWDSRMFQKYVDTTGILFFREMQEVGVPFPSWKDMLTVGGETDLRLFLGVGYACYEKLLPHLPPPVGKPAILDFGIGCGRTMRFFYRQCADYDFHGCDVDTSAIRYLQDEVQFVKAAVSTHDPPLPYETGAFDFIYCISVFTHFTQEAFISWMNEIQRILKPGVAFR
jgi:SAM-dependent methyltransferase